MSPPPACAHQKTVLEPLHYRVEDALRHITKRSVDLAIRTDVEKQILNSEALQVCSCNSVNIRTHMYTHSHVHSLAFTCLHQLTLPCLPLMAVQSHFEENPRDVQVLRHDAVLHRSKDIKDHLKRLPFYLKPNAGETSKLTVKKGKHHQQQQQQQQRGKKGRGRGRGRGRGGGGGRGGAKRRTNDPLRSFKTSKRSK